MKKRILPILLALLMVLSLIPASFAETGTEHEADLCEHEHEVLALVEETEAIEGIEPVEIPEEPEESEAVEPVELLDETDNDPETCPHEDISEYWDWVTSKTTFTDTGSNLTHDANGIREWTKCCADCGAIISEWEEEEPYSATEEHFYVDGTCVRCGHVNTCMHENATEDWQWDTVTYIDTGDNKTHEASGTRVWYLSCEDCDAWLPLREEEYSESEEHSFKNGVCVDCGHVNTCTHENTTDFWHWKDPESVTYIDTGDNKTHEASGVRVYETHCWNCSADIAEWEEEYTGSDQHSYDETGKCENCGHTNTCVHENVREYTNTTDETVIDIGDNEMHRVNETVVIRTYCDDCGIWLPDREETETFLTTHSYVDGICEYCGHVMTYTITATATPAAGGTVTGAGTYETGANVTMKATAKSGYAFVNWTENGKEVSKSATYSFKAAADRKLTANFKKTTPPAFDGTVELNKADVEFKGKTPYRVYNGKAQTPRVIVKDKSGKTVSASKYTVTYRNNTKPGTAYADVVMKDTGAKKTVWFKIYLPATTSTTVKNVGNGLFEDGTNGIQVSWKKVDGAKGYVIYRRAWNLKSKGWTTFERWNNTTKMTWIDTKVYPGTRYQYGVKAYFNDPMDNYNLGLVGPLKTMVRITTRQFTKSGASGDNASRWTLTWTPSSLFTGYQIQIANDEAFTKNVKTVTINNPKTNQYRFTGLKKHIWYYTRVRSYHVFEGVTYYGEWSFPTGSLYGKER